MVRKSLFSSLLLLVTSSTAFADTIVKFDLGETSPDVVFSGGVLFTPDDGVAGTPGAQETGIDFVGFLDPLFADIVAGGSFTLNGVTAVGPATVTGPVVTQMTVGGMFSLFDNVGTLLLAGTIGSGAISGSTSDTGSFFNVGDVTYTGGSLLAHVQPAPGGISLALADILTGTSVGLRVVEGALQPFTADADGLLTGEPIPEPMTLFLLGPAILGLAARRRR